METIPQTDADVERAKRNYEDTVRHLQEPERDFLEIGRLLAECKEYQFFKALGYGSFKGYVQAAFKKEDELEHSTAWRFMRHYQLSREPDSPPPSVLRRIGKAKMDLLLRRAEAGQVSPDLWKMAETDTWEKLRAYLRRYKPLGRPTPTTGNEICKRTHREIQENIEKIGESLGKYAQLEYSSYPSKDYRYDVVWKTFEHAVGATHVFEVCDKGGYLEHDINKLGYAYKTMAQPRLFLIVARPQDIDEAKSRVSGGSSGDMARNLLILTAQEIEQFYSELWLEPSSSLRLFVNLFIK